MRARWIALAAAGFVLAGCGASGGPVANVSPTSSARSASPGGSPSACAVPQPLPELCVGRAATTQEEQAMVAVGRTGAEADLKMKDWSQCTAGQGCFKVNSPSNAIVGTSAGAFAGGTGQYPQGGLGSFCIVFVFNDATGWHYANVSCVQNPVGIPGPHDQVMVSSGCANVRSAPSSTAKVLDCLVANTQVAVDSAPVYADGHIWWHLAGRGWMAHDFLAVVSRA